jgi:hypothetical protein
MRRRSRTRPGLQALALLVTLAAGCTHGLQPKDYPPAYSPTGAVVRLRVQGEGQDRRGELFTVDSIGVTIHADSLLRVHWARLEYLDVLRLKGPFDLYPRQAVTLEKRAALTRLSRFPQGLDGATLAAVLAALQLERIAEVP